MSNRQGTGSAAGSHLEVCALPCRAVILGAMRVDRARAEALFDRAARIVDDGEPLSAIWVKRTRKIGQAPNKTFVAMLGTALSARATAPRIDPLTLKASAQASPGLEGYSARGVATDVLVPCAVRHGVHLKARLGENPSTTSPSSRRAGCVAV